MDAPTTLGRPHKALLDWLASNDVEYEIHEHAEAFTAESAARAEGVDPSSFAKVIGVATDAGRRALLVLDATDHLDLHKARTLLSAREVRLLSEAELAAVAAGCEVGAMPAVGSLFGLDMYADHGVRDDRAISFNAGSHRISVRVDRSAWERATDVRYADLVERGALRPTWARS